MNVLNEGQGQEIPQNSTPTNNGNDETGNKDKLTAETLQNDLSNADKEVELENIFKRLSYDSNDKSANYTKDDKSIKINQKQLTVIFKELVNEESFMKIFNDKFIKEKLKLGNDNKNKEDFLKFFNEIKAKYQKKVDKGTTYKSPKDFETLGEAIVFRTACAFKNPDADIDTICKEIFNEDSDDRIKSLGSIESKFAEYGCLKGFAEYKKKNEKSNKEEVQSIITKLTPYYDILQNQGSSSEDVNNAIDEISSNIKTEFKHYYDEAQAAFEKGTATMKKNINDPNWPWVDPITGKAAEGSKNLKAGAKKLLNNVAQKADELSKKIMNSPHNLENDMLKVGVVAIKTIVGGVKAAKAIAKFFGVGKTKGANDFIKKNKETTNSTKSVLNKFKSFLKDTRFDKLFKEGFNEAFKTLKDAFKLILNEEDTAQTDAAPAETTETGNDAQAEEPKTKPGELSEELNKLRKSFMDEDNGFKKTGNTIFNYMIKSYAYLVLLANGTDKNKIGEFKKTDGATNTYEFSFNMEGNITYIQDKINLYINSIKIFNEFYDELKKKNEKCVKKLFVGDIIQSPQVFPISSYKLIKCIDSLIKDPQLSKNKIFIDNLNAIKKLYDKNGIFQFSSTWTKIKENPNGWSSDGKTLEALYKQLQTTLSTLNSIQIKPVSERIVKSFDSKEDFEKFKKDMASAFGGNKNIEFTIGDDVDNSYENISNNLEDLYKSKSIEDVKSAFETNKSDIEKGIEAINNTLNRMPAGDKKTNLSKIKDKYDKLKDPSLAISALYLKTMSNSMNESTIFNELNLLFEAEEQTEEQSDNSNNEKEINDLFNQIKNLYANDKATLDNFDSNINEINKTFEEINKLYDTAAESNEDIKNADVTDPLERLLTLKVNLNKEKDADDIRKNLPEEVAQKALDTMEVKDDEGNINVTLDFTGWKGYTKEGKTFTAFVYSKGDINQQLQGPAKAIADAYTVAYRKIFNKWCEDTEKGNDELKKKAIPLLKKCLGEKVEDQQENSMENPEELKKQFDAISQELEKLKEINGDSAKLDKIDELSKKLEEIDGKIQSTYDKLWKIVLTKDNKDEFKPYEINKDNTPVFQKIINVKAIMAKFGITESVVINEIKQLLLEETENKELDNAKKELKDLLDKKFEEDDLKKYDEIKSNIEKIEGVPEEIKEKPELVLALGDKEGEDSKEDKAKSQEYINQTKDILDDITVENISKKEFYDKLKAKFDKTEDGILDWCQNDEYKLKIYTDHKLPEDIKEEIIPKIWNAENFLRKIVNPPKQNNSYNPFYEYDFIMLLEAEDKPKGDDKKDGDAANGTVKNNGESAEDKKKNIEEMTEKLTKITEYIRSFLALDDENKFITEYKEFKNNNIDLVKKFGDKIENKENLKDPVQMITAMWEYVNKAKTELQQPSSKEKSTEGNGTTEEGSGKSAEGGGDKQQGNQEGG